MSMRWGRFCIAGTASLAASAAMIADVSPARRGPVAVGDRVYYTPADELWPSGWTVTKVALETVVIERHDGECAMTTTRALGL